MNEDTDEIEYEYETEVVGVKRYKNAHPVQPVEWDGSGVIRFKGNALVKYLLDNGPFDLNDLAVLPDISGADWEQFAQLIEYSVSGFGGLSYASTDTTDKADKAAGELQLSKYRDA